MRYEDVYKMKKHSLEECLALIENGDTIAVSGVATEPTEFLSHFTEIVPRLRDVTVIKSKDNEYEYLRDPATKGHVMTVGHFYAKNMREGHELGIASYIPSDLHNYMAERVAYKPNNVFVAQVADMEDGSFQIPYCKMFEEEAFACADKVILEVNPNLPRIPGGLDIHISRVTAFHEAAYPLPNIQEKAPTKVEETISDYIADLVSDGDCLELGTGTLSNAIAERLKDHRELGLHTEWFNTGAGDLIEAGIITGEHKNIDQGLAVASAAWGEERLYKILGSHPKVAIRPASYVCDPRIISQMNNMIAINTLIEMDLTGQVCSESIGTRQVSGSSGNLCFSLGAIHSKGGKSILCFPSMTRKGVSKIKTQLSPGANVTIPRNYVDYIVTEYGVARMKGRSVMERTLQLIDIAHPDVRDELRFYAKQQFYI